MAKKILNSSVLDCCALLGLPGQVHYIALFNIAKVLLCCDAMPTLPRSGDALLAEVRGQRKSRYLFESGWDTPAAGLHGAVFPAHVLSHLPVLLTALLSASTERRIAEERRNTVTGHSTGRRERERKGLSERARELASQPAEAEKKCNRHKRQTLRDVERKVLLHTRRTQADKSTWQQTFISNVNNYVNKKF